MKRNTMLHTLTFAVLAGLATWLAQPAHAQHWAANNFSWSLTNGGGVLVMTNNSGDNSIFLEGLSANWLSSASAMTLCGRYGAPLPQLNAVAITTTFTGNVGIGTNYPAGPLHLLGSSVPPSGLPADSNGLVLGSAGLSSYKWIQSYGGPLVLNQWGNAVGIGRIPSGPYALDVTGRVRAQSFTSYSDARFKTNITTLPNALDTVLNLRGVSFEWDRAHFADMSFAPGRQIGFVAQEVEKVLPELVTTDDKGYKSVAYANIVPVLVEATKVQQAQIEAQRRELESLKAQVVLLTQTVNQAKQERGLTGK